METTLETTALIPQESRDKLNEALTFFESLRSIKVSSQSEYDKALELEKQVKTKINELEKDRKVLVEPDTKRIDNINAEYRAVRLKLENAEKVIKRGRTDFFEEQERKRIEMQRKAEAEAAEVRRKAEEKAEAERKKAEEYARQGKEEMAAKAFARADSAQVKAEQTVAPIVAPTYKGQGASFKDDWVVEVKSTTEAITGCLANPVLQQFVSLDVAGLQKLTRSMKGNITIPGCTIRATKVPITRI
jgi:hypothetical protein